MPVSFNMKVFLDRKIIVKELTPERVHALLFNLFPKFTAEKIHNESVKPFSLSYQRFFSNEKEREVQNFNLKVSFLRENLFPPFAKEAYNIGKNKNLTIAGAKILRTKINSVNYVSYKELISDVEPKKDLLFQVITPATFKKGKYDNPSPEPFLVFKNLFRKWNYFSPEKFQFSEREFLKLVKRHVLISGLWLRTEKTFISPSLKKLIGFKGRLYFYVDTESEQLLRILNILLNFSEFSGIGRKTTMGFGRIKIIGGCVGGVNGKSKVERTDRKD